MIYIYAMRIQNGDQHGTAELLLNRSLEQCTDVQTPARYHRNEHGKPYLTETPEIYVNWSHSRDYVICAISDQEVGIDLQKMDREPKENLIRKALTEEEQEFYRSVPKPERQKLFYQYWSVKESFLKAEPVFILHCIHFRWIWKRSSRASVTILIERIIHADCLHFGSRIMWLPSAWRTPH